MFRKSYQKIIWTLVLTTFALSVPLVAWAEGESPKEIWVVKQENIREGAWAYQKVTDVTALEADSPEPMVAVFDEESGLYKISSEENLYLETVSDTAFQPMEKSMIRDTGDLRRVSEQYDLTATETKDIMSFMGQCPGNAIAVYAPGANETLGKYNGEKCRMVRIIATDDFPIYQIEKRVSDALSTLEKKINIGRAITHAVFELFGANFTFYPSDNTVYTAKNERVTFQYLDVYELGSVYITRGTTSYGTITLTTETTNWLKLANGDFVNEPIVRDLSSSFGQVETLSSLAAKSSSYFGYYGEISGAASYENYTTRFKIDIFNSIPAIQPKR